MASAWGLQYRGQFRIIWTIGLETQGKLTPIECSQQPRGEFMAQFAIRTLRRQREGPQHVGVLSYFYSRINFRKSCPYPLGKGRSVAECPHKPGVSHCEEWEYTFYASVDSKQAHHGWNTHTNTRVCTSQDFLMCTGGNGPPCTGAWFSRVGVTGSCEFPTWRVIEPHAGLLQV